MERSSAARSSGPLLGILMVACGSEPEVRFIQGPELDSTSASIVRAYLGASTLEAHAGDGALSFETLQREVEGDRIQILQYSQGLLELGLVEGPLRAPSEPCQRSCALAEPKVLEIRHAAGEWTDWAEAPVDPRLFELLLPAAQRGRCEACLEFELLSIDLGHRAPARFMLTEPDRETVLVGLADGRILRLGLEGQLETLCMLETDRMFTAEWRGADRLVMGGHWGHLTFLDLSDCSIASSTVNPSRDLLVHLAVHPTTGGVYMLDSNGRIDLYTDEAGFQRLAEIGALTDAELGGAVFDDQGRVFFANGSTSYAFGAETIEVYSVEVPDTLQDAPPRVRGVSFDRQLGRIVTSIEGHGLFGFRWPRFETIAAMVGEPGGLTPYRGGYVFGYKNGIAIQYTPELGLCPEILVGARRSPRLVERVGTRIAIGDAYVPRTEEEANSGAVIMTPRDQCVARGAP